MKKAKSFFNYETYYMDLNNCTIQNFLYYIVKSDAVITNSYHGTIFSIIFNKPFITIYGKYLLVERFHYLDKLFGIHDRLFENGQLINIHQLNI